MKRIRYIKDEGTSFYRELRQRVNDYFDKNDIDRRGNKKMYFKIALYFGLDILFYLLMIQSGSTFEFYAFYLLMGLSVLLTAFNVSHDASHGVAVKSKKLNKLLFQLSFNLQGNNAYVWGKNHTESHHLYTNIEGSDIDVLNNPLVRMTPDQPRKWFHKYQYLYVPFLYLFYSLNWFFFREMLLIFGVSSRTIDVKIPRREVFNLIIFKLAYIGFMIVLPAYILPFGIEHILLAFLFNHFLVSILFTAVLAVSHLSDRVIHPTPDESGRLDMSWGKLQLLTSIDYNCDSQFLNWTLGGFNAHAVHHLLPDICHVYYPKLMPIFREVVEKHGMTYHEVNYRQALASHFRFLKKMGIQQPNKTTSHESTAFA